MRRSSYPVTDSDVRPARPDGTCFYCRTPLGQEHAQGCVCRDRTIVCRLTIELVQSIPEDWTPKQFEFIHNGNSWCADNELETALKLANENECVCGGLTFIREATEQDEKRKVWGVQA